MMELTNPHAPPAADCLADLATTPDGLTATEAAMVAIRGMLAPRAAVLQDGARVTVDGADLVPGDIVLLEAGDKVPADLRVLEARGLAAQEAILTGESVPVEKAPGAVATDAALGDRRSMRWSGTLVTQGTARGLVVATGSAGFWPGWSS